MEIYVITNNMKSKIKSSFIYFKAKNFLKNTIKEGNFTNSSKLYGFNLILVLKSLKLFKLTIKNIL